MWANAVVRYNTYILEWIKYQHWTDERESLGRCMGCYTLNQTGQSIFMSKERMMIKDKLVEITI